MIEEGSRLAGGMETTLALVFLFLVILLAEPYARGGDPLLSPAENIARRC